MKLKASILSFFALPLFALALALAFSAGPVRAAQTEARAFFAPDGGIREAVIDHINRAEKSIHILSYYFSEPRIAKALGKAAGRGVKVEAVLDAKGGGKDKNPYLAQQLKDAGAAVYMDGNHKTMHNKVVIYDGKTVQTGSYNLRKGVDKKNAENVLFITSEDVAAQYLKDFQKHKAHSRPY